jgi:hypothetical protein
MNMQAWNEVRQLVDLVFTLCVPPSLAQHCSGTTSGILDRSTPGNGMLEL